MLKSHLGIVLVFSTSTRHRDGGIPAAVVSMVDSFNSDCDRMFDYQLCTSDRMTDPRIYMSVSRKQLCLGLKNRFFGLVRLAYAINEIARDRNYTCLSIQGLWTPECSVAALSWLIAGKPYIVYPRGMLLRYSLSQKRVKKVLAWILYQRYLVKRAKGIFVNSEQELLETKSMVGVVPIFNVGDGLPLESRRMQDLSKDIIKQRYTSKCFLYLGRIHRKKNVPILVDSWEEVDHSWSLLVCGDGDEREVRALRERIARGGNIEYRGQVNGREKRKILENSFAMVCPTDSESFGLVILESLEWGIPVILSENTPWTELVREYDCGIIIDGEITRYSIEKAVILMGEMGHQDYATKAANAIELSTVFNWKDVRSKTEMALRICSDINQGPDCIDKDGGTGVKTQKGI